MGNRSAEDMVKTLVEPKKAVISQVRERLLSMGYAEEVEYDAINIEPVLIYSKPGRRTVFLRHKWELLASIPVERKETEKKEAPSDLKIELSKYQSKDEDGNNWLKFGLPSDQEVFFLILGEI